MSLNGAGGYSPPTTCPSADDSSKRHPWHPPRPASSLTHPIDDGDSNTNSTASHLARGHLLMRNTLTGKKEPFVPASLGRSVKWYTCGPTVYDSSHVGHARTYLSLDIMRRVMSDYLNYDVLYQINTTDIDDKIILRARQNELLRRLEVDVGSGEKVEGHVTVKELVGLVEGALKEALDASDGKRVKILEALKGAKAAGDGRGRVEQEGLLEQHDAKRKNLEGDKLDIDKALEMAAKLGEDGGKEQLSATISALLTSAKSVLAEKLDRMYGHTITDHAIFDAHARKYEREFMDDMAALGIREPDILTRVTEYVPKIVEFVQKIIDKGLAYKSPGGSVYLNLDAFEKAGHNYRKLHPAGKGAATTDAEMAEGEGALNTDADSNAIPEKRNANDFTLWKASKTGEPAWPSPFGPGRPGWHIECSVVAGDILGETIDIHSGGEDLKFPHHDNELAQSEACFGCKQWVNYFTHTGHLHIQGLKMSKSLKNFVTIRQALEHSSARQLRIMFLMQAWDTPMNYSDQTVDDARAKEATFKNFFREVEATVRRVDWLGEEVGWPNELNDRSLADAHIRARGIVHERLLDNFDTKSAMEALLSVIGEANAYLRDSTIKPSVPLLRAIATYVTRMLKVFGVADGADDFGFGSGGGGDAGEDTSESSAEPFIDSMVSFRERVRNAALAAAKNKDDTTASNAALKSILEICDGLRDDALPKLGVRLEDRPTGTMWTRDDPEVMMREQRQKIQRENDAKVDKLEKRLAAKKKEFDKIQASSVKPGDLFRTEEFGEWDEHGVPVKEKDGKDVSGGQKKKKKKAVDKQAKVYQDLMTKSGGDVEGFLEQTRREVDEMKAQLAELSIE